MWNQIKTILLLGLLSGILLGIGSLFAKKRAWTLAVALVLVSALTSAISTIEYSYSQRSGLMCPFIILFLAAGLTSVFDAFRISDLGIQRENDRDETGDGKR